MAKDVLITPASGSIEVKNDADVLKVTIVSEVVTTANKILTLPNKTGTLAITTDVPTISGAASTIISSDLTASRAVISNASGKIDVSAVTSTELGYVSGVTSAIQTQLGGKEPTIATKNTAFNKNYGTTATDVKMNGTQGVGSIDAISRVDHVHPIDTSRVAANTAITSATKTKITYDVKGLVTAGADATLDEISDGTNYVRVTPAEKITWNGKQDALTNPVTGTGTSQRIAYWDTTNTIAPLATTTYPSLTELSYVKGLASAVQTQINGKEPTITAGTTSQYWRGDKSWQTLPTALKNPYTLTIQRNGVQVGNTYDGSSAEIINITDNDTTYVIATGDANGQIKVTPSNATAYNVGVYGLNTAAYVADNTLTHLAGTETITGSKTFSSPIIQNTAIGTAPLTITSTTKVSNLNVDMVDDAHVGSGVDNIPQIATALGTTDNVPVVTNTSGKLKPHASGALGSAAFVADTSLVHIAGTEQITGEKTFVGTIYTDAISARPGGIIYVKYDLTHYIQILYSLGEYGCFFNNLVPCYGDAPVYSYHLANKAYVDGKVSLTGNQTVAGIKTFSSTITSNVATGTAPLTVASTTVITNLNADFLDGQHGSYYATASSLGSYLPLAGGTMTGTRITTTQFPDYYYSTGYKRWTLHRPSSSDNLIFASSATADTSDWDWTKQIVLSPDGQIEAKIFKSNIVTGTAPFTVASTTKVTNLNADMVDGASVGTGVDNIPQIGTALGTTDNVPVVVNTSGKLKPHASGALGTAAFYADSTYVHIAGTETITGSKTFSSQVISNLAIGTAPFSIVSTTKVSNLNVDKVDDADLETTTFTLGSTVKFPASKMVGEYVSSRTQNLLTNGTALLGNNTNFSAFTFDGSETYYSSGSFRYTRPTNGGQATTTNEFIPVNPESRYKFNCFAKSNNTAASYYAFCGLYDVDGLSIDASQHMYKANTLTTLAQELKAGDTVVYLTSAVNWTNDGTAGVSTHLRSFIFWSYVNSYGYQYPPLTYSRFWYNNMWNPGSIDYVNNTVTLITPWTGQTFPVGTSLSNGSSGGTYKYFAMTPSSVPLTWTNYSGIMSGVDLTGTNAGNKFAPGTAKVKIGWLMDYYNIGSTIWFANLSFGLDYYYEVTQATKLSTARNINGVAFDGTANITIYDSTKVALTGTETITGAKTFSSAIISTVAVGTAPLTITSTTKVNNLNVDMLDGAHMGSGVDNIPQIATALGTTDNVPVVTNTSGKLKPHASGALKSAAFTESSDYQLKDLVKTNEVISVWNVDTTYAGYGYRATITWSGVTASDHADVIFSGTDVLTGNYYPNNETIINGIYIYSKVNTTITIPTIIIMKG